MPSKNIYTPSTQGYATFATTHTSARSDELDDQSHGGHLTAKTIITKVRGLVANNTGLLLVTGSQAFFALMNVAVKKLNGLDPPVPALELIFVRMGITYICCMTYMLSTGVPEPLLGPKGVRLLLILRGFCGFFGLFGIYYSLQYLSLSDATVLTFVAPLCTTVAGALLLGENFTHRQALAGVFSLSGVVLIARPAAIFGVYPNAGAGPEKGTSAQRLVAVCMAMVGVLGATGAYTSIRAIGKRAHPLHSMTFFSTQCVVASSVAMLVTKTNFVIPTRLDWIALFAMIGLFGFFAQTLLTMGLQRETAGRGTMAIYTQIVFASVLEQIFFHTTPSMFSVIGTVMILTSALYVALTKERGKTEKQPIADALEEGLTQRARENEANTSGG
ncbi:hypothetical protein K443DRAFT_681172 [Laccaria amethystina LaAM-08-1]|uniref:EamA domain-containing protein n=1 Tax=Laccaria amethystina LaAM-08-1 TaxID=1095629 RepID=A0A0C9X923_9AGAR|nr:hypothetical protein K443DRAFT_681172 [Laccaria amethystina LaAM-08-1]